LDSTLKAIKLRLENNAWLCTMLACFAVFILQQVPPIGDWLLANAALSQSNVFSMPWAWVTTLFLHASILHILLNMAALFLFGPLLERKIGARNFLLAYFAAGLIGNLGYVLTATNPFVVVIGASGAIYGVIGTLAILEPNMLVMVFFTPMPMWLAAIAFLIIELLSTGSLDSIAHFAHVFGIIAGVGIGWYYRAHPAKQDWDW
jgi:membrane associated rhomboid family serine protease